MTVTPPEPETFDLGPGTLTIGHTGTEVDISCLVNSAKIAMSKDEGDSTTKLCGTVKRGSVTYTYALSGNVDIDIAENAGFFSLSQSAKGTELNFTFQPNLDAPMHATGILVIDPLDFGGDEMGQPLTSDFEFSIVGEPTYAQVPPAGRAEQRPADTAEPRDDEAA
jgi:hypothetical protein